MERSVGTLRCLIVAGRTRRVCMPNRGWRRARDGHGPAAMHPGSMLTHTEAQHAGEAGCGDTMQFLVPWQRLQAMNLDGLPPRVGEFFARAKTAGYRVVDNGRSHVRLYCQDGPDFRELRDKVGGWNRYQKHWYVSKMRAGKENALPPQCGFRWVESSTDHWRREGEDGVDDFQRLVEAITGVSTG